MDHMALAESPLGAVVPIAGTDPLTGREFEHFAYVPNPLPTEVELRSATWKQVAGAEAALGRLDQASQQFPERRCCGGPHSDERAQSTSALEGTYSPFETVLASEPEDRRSLPMELREVLNYVVAAEEGFTWVQDRPITVGLIEHLQSVLVARHAGRTPRCGDHPREAGLHRFTGTTDRGFPLRPHRRREAPLLVAAQTGLTGSISDQWIYLRSCALRWRTISSKRSIPSSTGMAVLGGC